MGPYRKISEKGLGGVERYRRHHKLTRKEALKELRREDAYTLHKPVRKRFKRRSIIATHVRDLYQADLLDMRKYQKFNRGFKYILTVIDALSRYLYMVPIRSKKPQDVKKAFQKVFRDGKPLNLHTDRGLEFTAREMREYFKPRTNHYWTFTEMKAALCERVQRTIRERIARYFTSTGKFNYISVLPRIVADYNNSVHSVTGMKPKDVTPSNSEALFLKLNNKKKNTTRPRKFKYKVGDRVRLSLDRGVFAKGYDRGWTTEIFVVTRTRNTDPPVYHVKDLTGDEEIQGAFYEQELQHVE